VPAFNAQESIADTLRSAIAQTWSRKEIIVADDGSTDETLAVARQFESEGVRVVSQKNQGAAAARNMALSLSQGDYIQWLDADDLLAPDKITWQMEALDRCRSKRTLLSSGFGKFMYRWYRAKFVPTALWSDLSPTEWLLRKMGENLYMQTATWLVSRELTEAFSGSLSYIGQSDRKIKAHWLSMQLHIKYLRSLEDSERVRVACVNYLQRSLIYFYHEDPQIVKQAAQVAKELGGELREPYLSWKYSWVQVVFGWSVAKHIAIFLRKIRWSSQKLWDKTLLRIEHRKPLGQSVDLRVEVDRVSTRPSV
jgi:glycosyltransferase involved in cell wall biosynthesis